MWTITLPKLLSTMILSLHLVHNFILQENVPISIDTPYPTSASPFLSAEHSRSWSMQIFPTPAEPYKLDPKAKN